MTQTTSRSMPSFQAIVAALAMLTGGGTAATIAAGSITPALAQAQNGSQAPAGGAHGHRMGQMLMELNLSDAQKSQVRAIMADARKQNENVTDRDTRRANMKAAREKVEAVLTPAQRTELHAKMDAMRQQDQTPSH